LRVEEAIVYALRIEVGSFDVGTQVKLQLYAAIL